MKSFKDSSLLNGKLIEFILNTLSLETVAVPLFTKGRLMVSVSLFESTKNIFLDLHRAISISSLISSVFLIFSFINCSKISQSALRVSLSVMIYVLFFFSSSFAFSINPYFKLVGNLLSIFFRNILFLCISTLTFLVCSGRLTFLA